MLLVTNTRRDEAVGAASEAARLLVGFGISPMVSEQDVEGLRAAGFSMDRVGILEATDVDEVDAGLELTIVLGGDGTILRAAHLVRELAVPILGINLGHVGFLAEIERADLIEAVTAVAQRDYEVEERIALDAEIVADGTVLYRSWALNEVTVEKHPPASMIGLSLAIDGHDLTSFPADGVIVGTPTGSTAYSFSAGGPIVWPQVKALLVTPLSAHALFAKPLVIPPASAVTVTIDDRIAPGGGIVWSDSARSSVAPVGSTVVVRQSKDPVRLASLHHVDFVERLVRKFNLPSESWRNR